MHGSSTTSWPILERGERVVLVLGAGATISEMSQPRAPAILPPSDINFLATARRCRKSQVETLEEVFQRLWQGGEAYPLNHQRMEQLFASTFLKVAQTKATTILGRTARELYDELVLLLRDTLYETTRKALPGEHLGILRRIVAREPASLDIISFNYDCIADRAMRLGDQQDLWHWSHKDGYGFQPSNQSKPSIASTSLLLKLHGSMNWYIPIPRARRRTNYDAKAPIYVPNAPTRPDALAWHRRQRLMGHRADRRVFPLLIPPVFEKATQISGKLGSVWELAQEKLDRATSVIIWGYSLPATDYHAEMLFAQGARRARPRLLVANLDKSALGRVTEVCGHQWSRWFFRAYHLSQALDAEDSA